MSDIYRHPGRRAEPLYRAQPGVRSRRADVDVDARSSEDRKDSRLNRWLWLMLAIATALVLVALFMLLDLVSK